MTVYGVKPPCLPIELHAGHHHGSDCYKREETEYETGLFNEGLDEGLYIEPTAALKIPAATAAAAGTAQLQQDSDSANSEEGDLLALEPSREGRYLEFRRHTPTPSASAETDLEETARLINILPPETHTVTQTLWVTKVQKVIDHRITATLQAKNCVPVDLKIPFCPPSHKPPPKPTVIVVKPPHKPTVHKPTVPKPPVVLPPIHKPPILLPPIHKPPLLPTIKPPYHHEGYKPTGHWKEGENEDKNDEAETDESEAIAQDEVFEDESS